MAAVSTATSKIHPVLIVGAGLVGLSARLFLHQLGVPAIIVEKALHESPLPRSRGIHVRSMELFRQLGVEEAVKAAGMEVFKKGGFGGARRGASVLQAESLQAVKGMTMAMLFKDASPSTFSACPQTVLEPILQRAVEQRGHTIRWGCELLSFRDTGDAVEATVRDQDGAESSITASYLIAADGGRSFVRRQLGISSTTTPASTHYLNTYFRADLTDQMKDRTFSQCQVDNERVHGLFLSQNNTTLWSFHLEYNPGTERPMEYSAEQLSDVVSDAIGSKDASVELLAKPSTWSTAVRVADKYRAGRVFLVGDAAHTWPSDNSAHTTSHKHIASARAHCIHSCVDFLLTDTRIHASLFSLTSS